MSLSYFATCLMKSGASIHRIAGYGKKEIPDEKMQNKQEKLEKKHSGNPV